MPHLLATSARETVEPLRTLSNHRAALTSIALGHSAGGTNLCVSASTDNTVVVWDYLAGALLRTFLLPSTPRCLALDPCDRAVFIGFDDGCVQLVEFSAGDATPNQLYDKRLQNTPVQVSQAPWSPPTDAGAVLCLDLSYDGTSLLSGHASGKVVQWDVSRRAFAAELADLNAPVTNLIMQPVFPPKQLTRPWTVVKPKLGENSYTYTAQLRGSLGRAGGYGLSPGFPSEMLEKAIWSFSIPAASNVPASSGDDLLANENADLWKLVNEQRALQKKTWDQYTLLKSGGVKS